MARAFHDGQFVETSRATWRGVEVVVYGLSPYRDDADVRPLDSTEHVVAPKAELVHLAECDVCRELKAEADGEYFYQQVNGRPNDPNADVREWFGCADCKAELADELGQ